MTNHEIKNSIKVVVTGVGIISPIGNDVKSFWNNLLVGV